MSTFGLKEWSQKELLQSTKLCERAFAVFLYTPLCGTCKLTERMLEIIKMTDPVLPIYKSNINYLPAVSLEWKITSVPCIVIVKEGQPQQLLYSMNSVSALYDKLKLTIK